MRSLSARPQVWAGITLAVVLASALGVLGWLRGVEASAAKRQQKQITREAIHEQREQKERRARQLAKKASSASSTEAEKQRGPRLAQREADEAAQERLQKRVSLLPDLQVEARQRLYDAPREAAEFFRFKRLPAGAKQLPLEKYEEAQTQMRQMPVYTTALQQFLNDGAATTAPLTLKTAEPEQNTWTPLGPGNVGGRTRALIISPQDPNVMFAAGVSGGIWKTTNGGQAWTPIGDKLANLSVSVLLFDPTNANTIYAGTGEGIYTFKEDNQGDFRGAGIYKSTDGGATFTQLSATRNEDFYFVNDLVVSPANNQRLYAATRTGIWRSADGGTTWTRVLNPLNEDGDTVNGGVLDLAIRTDKTDADVVFAACGTFEQATIYRNTDSANTANWTAVHTDPGMGRTVLALAPSNQNIIYALASAFEPGPYQFGLHAVFRSTSGGDAGSWTAQVRNTSADKLSRAILSFAIFATATDCGYYPDDDATAQSWYDLALAVDPLDPQRVWVGGIDVFRSDDGGASWGMATQAYQDRSNPQYAHPDQHVLVFHPKYDGAANQILYVGNDGGLFRTDNARAAVAKGDRAACRASNTAVTWKALNNGYGVTQFYHGTVTPDGKTYFGGTQDNGTVLGTDATGINGWREINGGDGGYTAIDPTNANVLYAEYTGMSMRKSTDGGTTFGSARFGITGDSGLFITPFIMDPSEPKRLWTGGAYIWRSTNAASQWTRASSLTDGAGQISALAIAPTDANFGLVGMSDGYILRTSVALTSTATTRWPGTQLRNGYVSWLTFDPTNKNVAYATFSDFGGTHVWRSLDAGFSWTPLDGSGEGALPDVPVHCLVVDPGNTARLYLGTDVGVFVSTNGGNSWAVENTGFPNVITESLSLNTVNGETWLYAFTHGRGAWRVKLNNTGCNFALSPSTLEVSAAGGSGKLSVVAQPTGCPWTAASNAAWLQVTGSGNGNGEVSYTASANTSVAARAATASIAGRSFVVFQAGIADTQAPTVAITDPNPNTTANDTLGAITVRGTASDNAGIAAVTWVNDRGGSGTATGTTSWTISGLPLASGLNTITVTARDASNNVARASLTVNSRPNSLILTIIGNGIATASGDGAIASLAQLGQPSALAYDAQRNLYIADTFNDRIRKVNASDGKISTVAGGAGNGYAGDGGPATAAKLNCPTGVSVDAQGNIYIADRDNHRVRKVSVTDGLITTLAGTGAAGFSGDGGDAKAAQLNRPTNLVLDAQGNLLIADSANHRIRKLATDGKISTFAGSGSSGAAGDGGSATGAQLNSPIGLALDAQGNLFIADTDNNKVRRVNAADGIISTVAGTGTRGNTGDGGDARNARLGFPEGVWVDAQNNLIIADTFNDLVRRVNASDGRIATVAGSGVTGFTGDGGSATSARMYCPTAVLTDAAGRLIIADRENHRVRIVQTIPTNDTTPPVIALTSPVTATPFTTANSPITLSGTATDATGVLQVRWVNDRGFSGTASGTNAWTASNIPLLIGLNNLTVTAFDLSGNASSISLAITFAPQQVILTLAGTGTAANAGDGGAAVAAQLWLPRGVSVDGQGNVYVADTQNHRVRKISPSGVITAFAGNGLLGSSGDGGPATEATLNEPIAVLADSAGNVYISDYRNNRVRKVTPDGKIATVAGTGVFGDKGDGGLATQAELTLPVGLALDGQGNLYIAEAWSFADGGSSRVRKVNASDGKISTVAGNGEIGFSGDGGPATEARLFLPAGLAVDRQSNLYIVDNGNSRIRKVNASDGKISTIAGTGEPGYNGDNIPALNAQINGALGLTIDGAGDLYLADQINHRIRKISLTSGLITTVAGTGTAGFSGDNGAPGAAQLNVPTGVALDAQGNLYIADGGNQRVRKVQAASTLRTVASVSAASFTASLASEAIATAMGMNLATTTQTVTTLPLPTSLAGTSLRVRDSQGVERFAPLFYLSPNQINYLIPAGTANGLATVTVNTGDGGLLTGTANISSVAPALFAANADGQGVPAAFVLRVKANGQQTYEPVARLDSATNRFVVSPIDLGPEGEQVFLILFGTGLRNRIPGGTVLSTVGGVSTEVLFAGAQGGLIGLDQVNLRLSRALAGRGDVDLTLTVDGRVANPLRLNIK